MTATKEVNGSPSSILDTMTARVSPPACASQRTWTNIVCHIQKEKAVSNERKHKIMQSETLRKRQVFEVPATIVTFLALAADTGGSFSLFEYRVAPQQGIPLHRHSDDEAFLVLEGTLQFQIEEQHLDLGPGEFAFVPKQTPHRYLNTSVENEGRMLAITLPAGSHEGFFAEIGELKADASGPFSTKSPDIEKIMRVGKRYGFEILPPASS